MTLAGARAGVVAPERLVAVTVPVDPGAVDLLAIGSAADGIVWCDETGTSFAGRGVATRIDLPAGLAGAGEVAARLAAIAVEDGRPASSGNVTAGRGPVAFGALPFAPEAPAGLVVPAVTVGCRGHEAWITVVGDPDGALDIPVVETLVPPRPGDAPDGFELYSDLSHSAWRRLVAEAVEVIAGGSLRKVVLARQVQVRANRDIVLVDVLRRLHALYPSCMVFHVEGFLGASPELLVSRSGLEVASHPLAGTIARSGDPATDDRAAAALLESVKDRQEHRYVVDQVVAALEPLCTGVDVPAQPSILPLRNVSHLATAIHGHLRAGSPPPVLDLVARLHPTPAVAGTPTAGALAYLGAVEGFDRGRYAGPVGWMDASGDGRWALGIRSAEVAGASARLYAGVGVIAGSDPDEELAETQLKLQALLAALVRP